jgi:very-short-patch-repair endonuclease
MGAGGEGVKAVKAETTQCCPQRRSLARSQAQFAKARELRRPETESEKVAWRLLRTLRFKGFKFRRQHAVGQYIVDFCCPQRRLIVELDGSVHAQPSQTQRDTRRDAELKRMGHAVTRFPNGIVLEAPELFLEKVLDVAWSLPNAFSGEL